MNEEIEKQRDSWAEEQCELHDKNGPTGEQQQPRTFNNVCLDKFMLKRGFDAGVTFIVDKLIGHKTMPRQQIEDILATFVPEEIDDDS